MKILKNNTPYILIVLLFVAITLFLNLALGIFPIIDFLKYMQGKRLFWAVPLFMAFLLGLWFYNRNMRNKIANERIEIFNATIRTIQDILQNSASSMQLLILDMREIEIHEEIINKAEKNMDELKAVIKTLAAVDPKSIQLKDLNSKLSIIKMDE